MFSNELEARLRVIEFDRLRFFPLQTIFYGNCSENEIRNNSSDNLAARAAGTFQSYTFLFHRHENILRYNSFDVELRIFMIHFSFALCCAVPHADHLVGGNELQNYVR